MSATTCERDVKSSGAPTPALLSMISNLARGEVGFIVPGSVFPLRSEQSNRVQTAMYSESLADVWRSSISEIHKTSSKIIF
jgi:2,4-dienoyl-CoA reductase-like NADH-dependent reductase (Old Yellow Enzyme family)